MVGGVHCSGEVESQTEDNKSLYTNTDAMLDYIERFFELLGNKDYNMAALHAANSPQGILRTTDTLHKLAGNHQGILRTVY